MLVWVGVAGVDRRLGKFKPKEKAKWKFMQKYYHKGVFYMDDESMANDVSKDYHLPPPPPLRTGARPTHDGHGLLLTPSYRRLVPASSAAFPFQDVRKRDYSAPTLEDKFNKEALPSVMQARPYTCSHLAGRSHGQQLTPAGLCRFVCCCCCR